MLIITKEGNTLGRSMKLSRAFLEEKIYVSFLSILTCSVPIFKLVAVAPKKNHYCIPGT